MCQTKNDDSTSKSEQNIHVNHGLNFKFQVYIFDQKPFLDNVLWNVVFK